MKTAPAPSCVGRHRPVWRADAAEPGGSGCRRPACRSWARRPTPSTWPRIATASATLLERLDIPAPAHGIARTADEAVAVAAADRLSRGGASLLCAGRPRHGHRGRRGRRCAATWWRPCRRAPERPDPDRPVPGRCLRGGRGRHLRRASAWSSAASCSTSRRRASTAATAPACCRPTRSASYHLNIIARVHREAGAGAGRARADERPVRHQG